MRSEFLTCYLLPLVHESWPEVVLGSYLHSQLMKVRKQHKQTIRIDNFLRYNRENCEHLAEVICKLFQHIFWEKNSSWQNNAFPYRN